MTNDDIRERLVRIETKVDILVTSGADKESRIRKLEKWAYGIPPALIIAILGLAR